MKKTFVLDERCIPSEDVRNFINEIGWEFTDREIASLIYNNPIYSKYTRIMHIEMMVDEFTDETVISEIKDRLSYEKDVLNNIKGIYDDPNMGCYIYKLFAYEFEDQLGYKNPNRPEPILFMNYNATITHALKMNPKFGYDIIKSRIFTSSESAIEYSGREDGYDVYCDFAELKFDSDHNMYYYELSGYNRMLESRYPNIINEKSDRFEDFFVLVPYPFKCGDVLYDMERDDLCVLNWTPKWMEYKDIPAEKRPKKMKCNSFDDGRIVTESMDINGLFSHCHSLPFVLRKPNNKDFINEEEKEAYDAAHYLLNGEMTIQLFQMNINAYVASNKPKEFE